MCFEETTVKTDVHENGINGCRNASEWMLVCGIMYTILCPRRWFWWIVLQWC